MLFIERWPKIKGAELGEGGRKFEGPKIISSNYKSKECIL